MFARRKWGRKWRRSKREKNEGGKVFVSASSNNDLAYVKWLDLKRRLVAILAAILVAILLAILDISSRHCKPFYIKFQHSTFALSESAPAFLTSALLCYLLHINSAFRPSFAKKLHYSSILSQHSPLHAPSHHWWLVNGKWWMVTLPSWMLHPLWLLVTGTKSLEFKQMQARHKRTWTQTTLRPRPHPHPHPRTHPRTCTLSLSSSPSLPIPQPKRCFDRFLLLTLAKAYSSIR